MRLLFEVEKHLRAVSAHDSTVEYPRLDPGILKKLDALSYEIGAPNLRTLPKESNQLDAFLGKCDNRFETNADAAFDAAVYVMQTLPNLLILVDSLKLRCVYNVSSETTPE